jgi:predicted negative regulator of RcsB-dependent stress response
MTAKRRFLVVIGIAIIIVALGVAGWYLFQKSQPSNEQPAYSPYSDAIAKLKAQGPPSVPILKVQYYNLLAQNYQLIGDNNNALAYFLTAQTIIDDNHLQDQIVYYQAIASLYLLKQDKPHAKQYFQLQLSYLQNFLKQDPGNPATIAAIKGVQEQLKVL